MFVLEVFIGKFCSVNALAACTVEVGEISALAHKTRNNPMENAVFVAETLFASAQCTEVVRCHWYIITEQLENNASDRFTVGSDFEKTLGHIFEINSILQDLKIK
jgi:hypothetical protein